MVCCFGNPKILISGVDVPKSSKKPRTKIAVESIFPYGQVPHRRLLHRALPPHKMPSTPSPTFLLLLFLLLLHHLPLTHSTLNTLPAYTLQPPYTLPLQTNGVWHTSGYTSSPTGNFLRLTTDMPSTKGGVWTTSKMPPLGDEWQVTLTFNVWGGGEQYFGDGFALWYTEQPSLTGKVFGARDYWKGLGVLFDTYDNGNRQTQNHPFITVMSNDGTQSFIHGDSGIQSGVPACHSSFRSIFKATPTKMNPPLSQSSTVIVKYHRGRVTVDMNLHSSDTWTRCVDVEDVGPLGTAAQGTGAQGTGAQGKNGGYYLGVTASTGDLSDHHDIHSLTVSSANAPAILSTVATHAEMIAKDYEESKGKEDVLLEVSSSIPVPTAKENGGASDDSDEIHAIVEQSGVYQKLHLIGQEHDVKIQNIKDHLSEQLKGLSAHMESMLSKIKQSENDILMNIKHVETMGHIEINDALHLHRDTTHWVWGILILLLVVVVVFGCAWKKYQLVKKRHIL